MTRSGISYRISITFMLSITSLSRMAKKAKRLLLSEWWQLSPRCKNVIPLRWLWSLATLPVPFHFLHYAEKFDFPVVGVVPAIKPAARLTANGIVGLLATRGTVKRSYTHELIARFANECQIEMLGSAEMVELAEAKLHGEDVSLDALKRILRPWLRMKEPPDTVVLGCTHFPLLQEELLQVLPEGTRLVDSGAAIARRTAWLLEHEAPDAKSADANIALLYGNDARS
ncbi:glutamate racemase [Escherichia coli]|uniref:Glutamate racemase n=1 Tax=Escherichia coli TaxID=562 RepID=A0A376RQV3_ECOLX|nr:glutamate racemase [Escherichia coli]